MNRKHRQQLNNMSPTDIETGVDDGLIRKKNELDQQEGDDHDPRSFVDFVPPEVEVKVPAKWKLWLIILVCVSTADWWATEADFNGFIGRTFHLNKNEVILVSLIILVPVLLYGGFDLISEYCRFKINGKEYGVERWLKQPRATWIHRSNSIPMVILRVIVEVLEDGFAIFDCKPPAPPPPKQFDVEDEDEESESRQVCCRFVFHVRKEKNEAYLKWQANMKERLCNKDYPGINSVTTTVDSEKNIYTTLITFSSIDHLNEYMESPLRARLVKKLRPLLAFPTILQLRQARQLPDAFTDLSNKQGLSVPTKTPKKWKVWIVIVLSLWSSTLLRLSVLPFYFKQWGITTLHPRLESFFGVFFGTLFSSYIMMPFQSKLFGDWLVREEVPDETDALEPWRTLNDGCKSNWTRALLVIMYYGGFVVAWIIRVSMNR